MAINGIGGFSSFSGACSSGMDPELAEIARRLRLYGIIPTGNKSTDKNTLRKIELEKAKQEPAVSNKFLLVTKGEQERIQNKKKENKKTNLPKTSDREMTQKAMNTMGEQIYFAIKWKDKKSKQNKSNEKI